MTGPWTRDLPERVVAAVGVALTLELPAAHGGYDWSVTSSDPGLVAAEVEVGEAPSKGDPPSSAAAPVLLVLHPHAVGSAEVELRLARAWQPEDPLATHVVHVEVGDTI